VLYVAAEGLLGLKYRRRAYNQYHRLEGEEMFYIDRAPNLLKGEDVDELLRSMARLKQWAVRGAKARAVRLERNGL
jgi:hypothetical protein